MKKNMKKIALSIALLPILAHAEYSVLVPISDQKSDIKVNSNWSPIAPLYGNWTNSGPATNCKTWTPSTDTVVKGTQFNQTANDCTQVQTRTVTGQEVHSITKQVRNSGVNSTETRTILNGTSSRTAIGTYAGSCRYTIGQYGFFVTFDRSTGKMKFYFNGTVQIDAWASVANPSDARFPYNGKYYYPGALMEGTTNNGYYQLCTD